MKKVFFSVMAAAGLLALASCNNKTEPVYEVSVQITQFGESIKLAAPITLTSSAASFTKNSDENGLAAFQVPAGSYTANVSVKVGNTNYNGSAQFVIEPGYEEEEPQLLPVTASNTSALIIKELYTGGCKQNSGTSNWINDKYVVIYNNSAEEVDASRMCIGMGAIANSQATNKYPDNEDGISEFELAGWCPACNSLWWFQTGTEVKIPAYSQITIAIAGAINHTTTYTNSVDLSGVDYVFYDKEAGYNNATWYPAPAAGIPESHYMKTYEFGQGNAWSIGTNSAGLFILIPDENTDIKEWVKTEANFDNRGSNKSTNFAMLPIPWVLDAIDVWQADDNSKYYNRFPKAINVGCLVGVTGAGYSQYRNVDKDTTEAIAENQGKLVYNYAGAVDAEKSDPSGIDAEASMANGAKIVFKDTNNSAADFHVRKVASLKK